MVGSEALQELYSRAIEHPEHYAGEDQEREEQPHRDMRALEIIDEIVFRGTVLEGPILGDDEGQEVRIVPKGSKDG